MPKGLEIKVREFWELIPTFVEVTGEKLVGDAFFPILNRVNYLRPRKNDPIIFLIL